MTEQQRRPRRFGVHASIIQLVAFFTIGSSPDGGTTQMATTLASLLFWTCSALLLAWHRGRISGLELFFFRWGLLLFVLIGTPLLRPIVQEKEWLAVVLDPGTAVLLVMPFLYLVV
jgi:hypothetical protein